MIEISISVGTTKSKRFSTYCRIAHLLLRVCRASSDLTTHNTFT
jgi:hypothetical protein